MRFSSYSRSLLLCLHHRLCCSIRRIASQFSFIFHGSFATENYASESLWAPTAVHSAAALGCDVHKLKHLPTLHDDCHSESRRRVGNIFCARAQIWLLHCSFPLFVTGSSKTTAQQKVCVCREFSMSFVSEVMNEGAKWQIVPLHNRNLNTKYCQRDGDDDDDDASEASTNWSIK